MCVCKSETVSNLTRRDFANFLFLSVLFLRTSTSSDQRKAGWHVAFINCLLFNIYKVAVISGLQLELGKSYTIRWTLNVNINERFDCYPNPDATKEKCEQLGCSWEVSHYFSKKIRQKKKKIQNERFSSVVVTE